MKRILLIISILTLVSCGPDQINNSELDATSRPLKYSRDSDGNSQAIRDLTISDFKRLPGQIKSNPKLAAIFSCSGGIRGYTRSYSPVHFSQKGWTIGSWVVHADGQAIVARNTRMTTGLLKHENLHWKECIYRAIRIHHELRSLKRKGYIFKTTGDLDKRVNSIIAKQRRVLCARNTKIDFNRSDPHASRARSCTSSRGFRPELPERPTPILTKFSQEGSLGFMLENLKLMEEIVKDFNECIKKESLFVCEFERNTDILIPQTNVGVHLGYGFSKKGLFDRADFQWFTGRVLKAWVFEVRLDYKEFIALGYSSDAFLLWRSIFEIVEANEFVRRG